MSRSTGEGRAARGHRGLSLVEVLALVAIVGILLVLFARPSITQIRSGARIVCGAHVKGIGMSCRIYANENLSAWPVPPFDETRIGSIDYTVSIGGGEGSTRSPNRMQESIGGDGGARQLSVTRSLWILVRSGEVTPNSLHCNLSDDVPDPTDTKLGDFYDFTGYRNISYAFQVPFGASESRAGDWMAPDMILAADKGPYVHTRTKPPTLDITVSTQRHYPTPSDWRPFNSPNHKGEGQNVLFADGHWEFHRVPTVGPNNDNIYTVAGDDANGSDPYGESPWARSAPPKVTVKPDGSKECRDVVLFP